MTDRNPLARSSSHVSSSSRAPTTDSPSASSSVRPRNRRLISTEDAPEVASSNRSSGLLSAFSPSISRAASPLPSTSRSAGASPNQESTTGDIGQFLAESWTQSWSSVQGITSTFFSNTGQGKTLPDSRNGPKQGPRGRRLSPSDEHKTAVSWGPAPPSQKPSLDDVASGSVAKRQAALKAARTASVLESHEGVNGGLDVSGKHKRRNSDEVAVKQIQDDDYLAYIHKVQPNDTYAGLILRYRCREDAFRRANGLWSRDNIQTRKWLSVPVDACDVRGRPCDAPSWHNSHGVDLLAPTPSVEDAVAEQQAGQDDFFSKPANGATGDSAQPEEDKPWTHVRWVKIDTIAEPVEIGRIARGTMGYFPPRRKRSIRTVSSLSTPRQSLDLPGNGPASVDGPSQRRPSSLSSRPFLSGTPTSSRSRMGSDAADGRPAWMKRPGGVGTFGRNARAPGPDKDAFDSWTRKHIPGLNIEAPSMSIMGSETAQFGFNQDAAIAENSREDGRDISTPNRQGTSLDRAASSVETWLRGAFAKRPGTPLKGLRSTSEHGVGAGASDLIELTDAGSDDGRAFTDPSSTLIQSLSLGSSSGGNSAGSIRGRTMASGAKGKKAD